MPLLILIIESDRRVTRPTHKPASNEPKAKSQTESKEMLQIVSADTEALIEKVCPHANVTASGRSSGLAYEQESRGHETGVEGKRREKRESSDFGEMGGGKEPKSMEDKRTEETQRATKDGRDVLTRLCDRFFTQNIYSGSERSGFPSPN